MPDPVNLDELRQVAICDGTPHDVVPVTRGWIQAVFAELEKARQQVVTPVLRHNAGRPTR